MLISKISLLPRPFPSVNEKLRILFVCHGNICRSPMAEFIMRDIVEKEGFSDRIEIESCATSSEELGNPIYPPARRILEHHNIACTDRIAVRMTSGDYDRFDMIFAMDRNNLRNMRDRIRGDPDEKVRLLMDCVGKNTDIPDPWYTGNFEKTFEEIFKACTSLMEAIRGDAGDPRGA